MNNCKTLNIIWNDRRVRTATITFLIPLLILVLFERFTSLALSILYIFAFPCLFLYLTNLRHYKFGIQAWLLGVIAGYSILIHLLTASKNLVIFSRYTLIMCFFHFSEMFFIGITNNDNLKADSFLLNHSVQYWLAAILSWLEFGIESMIMPWLSNHYVSCLGVLLCMSGEIIRKLAMWHASSAFTHLIAYRKNKNHSLVTTGIYAYVRHPGYLGWFLWSIGTQVTLCNPLCFIVYMYVAFRFFEDRIHDEERYLIEFFGRRYISYKQKVACGIPFIQGYQLPPNVRLG